MMMTSRSFRIDDILREDWKQSQASSSSQNNECDAKSDEDDDVGESKQRCQPPQDTRLDGKH